MNKFAESFIADSMKSKERCRKMAEEMGRIAKMAKEDYKKVTHGEAGGPETLFILGYIAGYNKSLKEKEG